MTQLYWKRYPEVEPLRRLLGQGSEFIRRITYIQVKEDGANVSVTLEFTEGEGERWTPVVYTHNQAAAPDIVQKIQSSVSWNSIVTFLHDQLNLGKHLIIYGELVKPAKQNTPWLYYVFDIRDAITNRFLSFPEMKAVCLVFAIMTITTLSIFAPASVEDLVNTVKTYEGFLRENNIEGIVVKAYGDDLENGFADFKFRLDKPVLPKSPKAGVPVLPAMPEEKIKRCLEHTWDKLVEKAGTDDFETVKKLWNDPKVTMPIFASVASEEANEHGFAIPRNLYTIYQNGILEDIAT